MKDKEKLDLIDEIILRAGGSPRRRSRELGWFFGRHNDRYSSHYGVRVRRGAER